MNKFGKTAAILIFIAISLPVHAVVIGDRDWMQVALTTGFSWDDFDAVFDISTGRCDVARCLLDNGITSFDVSGYVWADNSDVNDMIIAATGGAGLWYLDRTNGWDTGNPIALDNLFMSFDPTAIAPDMNQVRGWTREENSNNYGDYISLIDITDGIHNDRVHLDVGVADTVTRTEYIGGWLYKASVPEPSLMILISFGLVGMGAVRRHKCLKAVLRI